MTLTKDYIMAKDIGDERGLRDIFYVKLSSSRACILRKNVHDILIYVASLYAL